MRNRLLGAILLACALSSSSGASAESIKSEYERAAEQGDREAMLNAGLLYEAGQVVERNPLAARRWFEKAAAAGCAEAMNNLGSIYDTGDGVKQNYRRAKCWYEKAAAAGAKSAMYNLGIIYIKGEGVKRDEAAAKRWFEKADAYQQINSTFFQFDCNINK